MMRILPGSNLGFPTITRKKTLRTSYYPTVKLARKTILRALARKPVLRTLARKPFLRSLAK